MTGILSDLLQVLQVLAVVFGIAAFYIEYRKGKKDKGYETYVQTILATVDMEKIFIEHPDMQELWTYDTAYRGLSKAQRKMYHWCAMLIDVFEIVFIASPRNRKWMSEDEWDGWERYMEELLENSEIFRTTWDINKELYCARFQNYMNERFKSIFDKFEQNQPAQRG